jgi:hypothetical protein
MAAENEKHKAFPAQHQDHVPGIEHEMRPRPRYEDEDWVSSGLLQGRTAVITGADSGIGRAVAVLFAREGADVVASYLSEEADAAETRDAVERAGGECLLVPGDLSEPAIAERVVAKALERFGHVDVLVNNAAIQYEHERFSEAPLGEIRRTVDSNLMSALYVTHACLPHLKPGAAIIFSVSITAYRGSDHLATYAATKGALVAFTRSLALQLAPDIRVNAVAPGPVWTPLIPASFSAEQVAEFGTDTPLGRAAQPVEIAPSYLFLASERWSGYITGQVVHPNGGSPVNT